jgi:P27 family predicted phage terminase small subunit
VGRRGPKAKPTALKLERGTPGHHKVNSAEPELPKPTTLKPPKGMSVAARAEWKRLADLLVSRGVLTEADMHGFQQYCTMVAEIAEYEKLISVVGREDAHRLGYANYLIKLRARCSQQEGRLGLDPSSRSGVQAVKVVAKDAAATKRERFFGTGA